LKSSESHQLTFAFANNSKEGGQASKADVSAGKAYLLHYDDLNLMKETDARTDSGRDVSAENLLEKVASLPNLATALLRVARNKGASGVEGLNVQEVVAHSQQLPPKVQRALLQGKFSRSQRGYRPTGGRSLYEHLYTYCTLGDHAARVIRS